ncbi:hypothetical protein F8388_015112 [Cannabis sativa]|uniref:G domain-containing protein n=1 Tax=Cannabis sativa TaxID=3483 RepID=A0A7J6ESX4_CANSA|nr:hypothetical protein F8388_015112 [Cannabis sativa]KAF4395366.1 hypothetical protein G4B88_010830 [Cannabis sativa]
MASNHRHSSTSNPNSYYYGPDMESSHGKDDIELRAQNPKRSSDESLRHFIHSPHRLTHSSAETQKKLGWFLNEFRSLSMWAKGSLLSILRQFACLKSDKQAISVGFVGYFNVGKSSVINTLRTKTVCKVAPIPGETKVWQSITLTKRIFLIDCPGVVYQNNHDTETDIVLKGVVRVTNLEDASEHIGEVLTRVKKERLERAYKIKDWLY